MNHTIFQKETAMREPKTPVEKVWEQHVVRRVEGGAAHLRRACGGVLR
jgi:hypothetical protein